MKILGIIPARGGSKGVSRKNIRRLAGKPLIAHTIETALKCPLLHRVIVSTDDEEIAEIARKYGAEAPFMRPSELAQDDTPDLPVCQHALSTLAESEGYCPDIIVWLRPTVPFRTVNDLEATIRLILESGADTVRSVCLTEHHPYWMKRMDGERLIPFLKGVDEGRYFRRQMLPPAYRLNGAVDVIRSKSVIKKKKLYGGDVRGYVMPVERSMELHTEMDFAIAESLLHRRE